VVEAERHLARAEIDRAVLAQAEARRAMEIARLTAEVETARRHRTEIDRPLALQALPDSKVCAGRRGSWNCSAAVQSEAVRANAEAQKAHSAELKDASALVKTAEARLSTAPPGPDTSGSDARVAEAKRAVADARAINPMFRIAAAWSRTPVEDLTAREFETVKHWAVIALSGATALATALAAIIASLRERDARPGKLSLALRKMIAARRKTLRRLEETVRVEVRDRVKLVYVPVHADTGLPVDPADTVTPLRVAGGKP
jgi:hypothetical protein